MKIYFTASLTGKKYYLKNYKKIVEYLEKLNCEVFSEHIFSNTREQIRAEGRKERIKYLNLLHKNLSWCDAVVAEVSYPSTSVGYEMSLGISKAKPVVALYYKKGGDFPPLLKAHKEEDAMLVDYSFDNLKSVLIDCLNFIKTKTLEKRFTMLLSPKIVGYLDKICLKKKIPRSVYIRKLIEEDMKRR